MVAPALAVFLTSDDRKYSDLLEPMRECRDYIVGGCRFTLRFRSENNKCAVYEIQPILTERKSIESP